MCMGVSELSSASHGLLRDSNNATQESVMSRDGLFRARGYFCRHMQHHLDGMTKNRILRVLALVTARRKGNYGARRDRGRSDFS